MLVEPFMLSQASGGSPRAVSEPMPTQTTGGNGGAHALISPYYGGGSGETCSSANEPLPTATAKARFGVVVPVTNTSGGPRPRSVDEPLPTMTTAKGGEFAVVTPVTHHDASDRVRSTDQPLATITGANRGEQALVEAVEGLDGYDILFRMLEPHELGAAMGFTDEEYDYTFTGTKTEQVKQIGNAVEVKMMTALVSTFMEDSAPRRARKADVRSFDEAAA